jgi:hypothetical protein
MRRLALVGGVSMALVSAVACATSEEATRPNAEPEPSIPDASVPDVAVGSDAPVEPRGPLCSSDGWCETILPDSELVVRDIWPLSDRAFAVADSLSAGVKVLEWTSTDSTWRIIDDNSQNETFADRAVKVWSPNADEVYFAIYPGTIFHGRRPVAPATAWSWSSQRLEDNNPSPPPPWDNDLKRLATGVWGASSNDVYAWHANTVFRRRTKPDGALEWIPEYIANDFDAPNEQMYITGIAGKDANDLWFAGVRYGGFPRCTLVVRKTADGYRRVADGVLPGCMERAGIPLSLGSGWPGQFQSPDGHRFLLLKGTNEVVQVAPDGDGYSVSTAGVPPSMLKSPTLSSLWGESENRLWLGVNYNRSGIAIQGDRVWEDGGEYQYSSLALNGAPLPPVIQIRGTSNTNLWAVGDRYAIHKTTP